MLGTLSPIAAQKSTRERSAGVGWNLCGRSTVYGGKNHGKMLRASCERQMVVNLTKSTVWHCLHVKTIVVSSSSSSSFPSTRIPVLWTMSSFRVRRRQLFSLRAFNPQVHQLEERASSFLRLARRHFDLDWATPAAAERHFNPMAADVGQTRKTGGV